ncbi:MAG: flagellar hook-basal body complex protein FliE [Rhizobiales bacterium]|nr:flagellar hook-basal body complex protein FliE [Hyphomicrobiales bacterium]
MGVSSINSAISAARSMGVEDAVGLSNDAKSNVGETASVSFKDVLFDAGKDMVGSVQKAEAMSIKGIKGEASAYDVASAVVEAEQSLKMAVAVRDKIVSAYLEISRMQI